MKSLKLLLLAFVAILVCSCSDKKQQQLIDELTAGINEGKAEQLSKAFPGIDALKLDLTGCQIAINADSIVKDESNNKLSIPATITKKDGTKVPVNFTATTGEEAYTITDVTGILPLAKNALWATVAKKTGAIEANASEKDILNFVNNEDNVNDINAMLDAIKSNIISVKVKFSNSNWHDGDDCASCYGTVYYTVTITNNSQTAFNNVEANYTYSIEDHGYTDTGHATATFSTVNPGTNTAKISVSINNCDYITSDPHFKGLSGITDDDYQKAMETYNFTGHEYADYIANK